MSLTPQIMNLKYTKLLVTLNELNFLICARFEKKKGDLADPEYSICGYMTVYHYYAYPMNMRPRIRYFQVLPFL